MTSTTDTLPELGSIEPNQHGYRDFTLGKFSFGRDEYFVLADFAAYVDAQEAVSRLWADPDEWSRRAILNVARMGYFSSDRAIREYGREIWKVGKETTRP